MSTLTNCRFRVAGVTRAPGYPRNLIDLQACMSRGTDEEPLELDRDRNNVADVNAVAVRWRSRHLGWVPAALAAQLAPSIDRGESWSAVAKYVAVHPEHRERPGFEVALRRGES